jgi:glutathione S-transferase
MPGTDNFVLRSTVTSPFGRKVWRSTRNSPIASNSSPPTRWTKATRCASRIRRQNAVPRADDGTIYDSGIIIEYLQDVAGTDRLLPLKGATATTR